jgi:hypothetical protein
VTALSLFCSLSRSFSSFSYEKSNELARKRIVGVRRWVKAEVEQFFQLCNQRMVGRDLKFSVSSHIAIPQPEASSRCSGRLEWNLSGDGSKPFLGQHFSAATSRADDERHLVSFTKDIVWNVRFCFQLQNDKRTPNTSLKFPVPQNHDRLCN